MGNPIFDRESAPALLIVAILMLFEDFCNKIKVFLQQACVELFNYNLSIIAKGYR